MSTDRLLNVAVGVLTVCALVTTGLVVRRELSTPRAAAVPGTIRIPTWHAFAREGHRMGPAEAPVKIVVFSDFQCPYCAVLMERLRMVREARPTEVAVVYRHFPIDGHRHAVPAARASECAAEQGRFEPFHDALFAAQDSIGAFSWDRFATTAGVGDLPRFNACAAATGPVPALGRDTLAGNQLYVTGTPTLLINERRLQGVPSMDSLEVYVRQALRSAAPARSR